jgi:hypothetical protein
MASAVLLLALAPAVVLAADSALPAGEIIAKALDRARQQKEQGLETSLRFRYRNRRTKFDSNGKPASTEERLYRAYPLDGEPYYELIEIDGKPPGAGERERERKRQAEFRQERAKQARGEKLDEEDERVGFNEDLIERYTSTLERVAELNGRRAYVLRFEPREGELPVRKRIDHALNNSAGRLWIDAQEFGVARIEFNLLRPVKFWGGLIGAIRAMDGRLEFTRLEGGVWHPTHMEVRMEGRVLWNSLNQKMVMDWLDFQAADEAAKTAGQ